MNGNDTSTSADRVACTVHGPSRLVVAFRRVDTVQFFLRFPPTPPLCIQGYIYYVSTHCTWRDRFVTSCNRRQRAGTQRLARDVPACVPLPLSRGLCTTGVSTRRLRSRTSANHHVALSPPVPLFPCSPALPLSPHRPHASRAALARDDRGLPQRLSRTVDRRRRQTVPT